MGYIQWSEEYLVGVEQFDEHHRILFDLLGKVYGATALCRQASLIKPVVEELTAYTRYHFEAESDLMRKHDYPGRMEHEREHEIFTEHVAEVSREIERGGEELALQTAELAQFLGDWLAKHIRVVDKQYSVYLRERGVS